LPGLGHFSLGETRRAIGIAAGILGLFVSGLFIGGIDCVDRRENPVWFIGQALVGPVALATDWVHQSQLKVIDPRTSQLRSPLPNEVRGPGAIAQPAKPGERPPYSKSLGKMNELGTLFCAIAGMINLIAIVDVAYHRPRRAPRAASTTRGPRP
jgi:hypothetical protein